MDSSEPLGWRINGARAVTDPCCHPVRGASTSGPTDSLDRRLLTIKQTAEQLACSEANVYALVGAGQLPFVRVGKRKGLRIDSRDLHEFIESRKVQYERARPTPPRPRLKHIKL